MRRNRTVALLLGLLGVVGFAQVTTGEVVLTAPQPAPMPSLVGPPPGGPGAESVGPTPPRLSYMTGEVSFWRPGASDWVPAQLNMPLAPGDQLYTGPGAIVELQVGGRAFARAAGETQLGLANQESSIVQLTLNGGAVALDIRELEPGQSLELSTPTAALTVDQPGYYLTDVRPAASVVILQRGGRATLALAGGTLHTVVSGQQVVLRGEGSAALETSRAPELTDWDRWNVARTDSLVNAQSSQYVPLTMYGVADLDRHGSWRVEAEYGPVWTPQAQPAEWAPYSAGRWIWDPYYGWTWVDDAPWGWAPYHYGRWISLNGMWAWAPGPFLRPVYSPALVAFFGPGVGFGVGGPLGWVALGWGEPIIPWWGPSWFVGRPCWVGWHGPRVVNNVVINKTTVVNVTDVKVHQNTRVKHALVAVPRDRFGTRQVASARLPRADLELLKPVASVDVTPTATSFVPATGSARRPPAGIADRRVITRRPLPATSRDVRPPRGTAWAEDSGGRRAREFRSTVPVAQPDVMARPPRPPGVGADRGASKWEPRVVAPEPHAGPPPPPRPGEGFGKVERSSRSYEPRMQSRPALERPAGVHEAPSWSTGRAAIPNPPAGRDGPSPPLVREAPKAAVVREAPRPPSAFQPGPSTQRAIPGQVVAPRASASETSGRRPGGPPAGGGSWRAPDGAFSAPKPAAPRRLDSPMSRETQVHPSYSTPGAFHSGAAPRATQQPPRSQWAHNPQPGRRGPLGEPAREFRTAQPQGRSSDRGDRGARGSR